MPLTIPTGTLGVDWSPVGGLPTTVSVRDLTVSPSGQWICTRAAASSSILRSTNAGSTWSSVSPPSSSSTESFTGAAFGGGLFSLVQSQTRLWSSPDGLTWTSRGSLTSSSGDITYNDGYFVRGAESSGNAVVAASPDGITWTVGPQGAISSDPPAAGGIYVAALNRTFAYSDIISGTGYFRYVNAIPTSATSWTGTPTGITGEYIDGVAWSPTQSIAVAVGRDGVFSSANLITWTLRSSLQAYAVAWCETQFVSVGPSGRIRTSPDGITWTTRTSGTTDALRCVASSGGVILVGGDNGTVLRSS